MKWEKYKVPLLELGLIVTCAVAVISLASVFILNARLKNIQTEQTVVRENSAAVSREELEQKLMVYGSADDKALVIKDSVMMQALAGDEIVFNEAEGVFAACDTDGHYYVWRMSDGELLSTFANLPYDRAIFIGSSRILLEDNGQFYCFDYTSGMQLWKWQFPCEECVWEYDDRTEQIYVIAKSPDKETQTVVTSAQSTEDYDDDDWDEDDWDNDEYSQTSQQEVVVSLSHDICILSTGELTVNYIRPLDLLSDEMNYDSAFISDMTFSEDRSMLMLNGYLSDPDEQYDRYFTKIYSIGDLVFEETITPEPEQETGDADSESQETGADSSMTRTTDIVKAIQATYNESGDTGYRMMTRWIDNESVLQYSEQIDPGADEGDDWDEDDENENGTIAANEIDVSAADELDEDPETVEWSVRKKTLPYGSSSWRVRGNGQPTENFGMLSYVDDGQTYLILNLSQCALTLSSDSGQEIASVIDTDDFIYIEPKGTRPAMYITHDGSVVQGKRHYGLGVSEIFDIEKVGDTYYVAAENSIFRYTMAGNLADSGMVLRGSDDISWNRAIFSADGKYAALSGQRFLSLFDTSTGRRIYQNVCSLQTGPDTAFIGDILCHIDSSGRHFMIFDPAVGKSELFPLPGAVTMQKAEIRTCGTRYILVAGEEGQILWLFDTSEKEISRTLGAADLCEAAGLAPVNSAIEYCQMSPDAKYLVYSVRITDDTGSLTLKAFVMDMESGKTAENDELAEKLDVPFEELPSINCTQGTFSSDGKYALFVGDNNAVSVLELETAEFALSANCGELMTTPCFSPDDHIVCITKGGDLCAIDSESGKFVATDEENKVFESDDLFSLDRLDASVSLTFDRDGSKMYAYGVKSGKTFVRVYSISGDGLLTPETEIPYAVTCDGGTVLMRYGYSEAELFPYLSMEELEQRAAAAKEQAQ